MVKRNIPPHAPSSSNRWLITGGCGFIGRNLIKYLLSEGGSSIRVLDNLSVGTRSELEKVCNFEEVALGSFSKITPDQPSSVELAVCDIRDPFTCFQAVRDVDVIVHLAANTGVGPSIADPRSDMEANVIGTFNILEAARKNGVNRLVFASSGAPVGECTPPINEGIAPHPVSPYGASKLAGEGYCSAYFRSFGIQTVCLRFGNVYGPLSGHKESVVAKFIKAAMEGRLLEIYGDGQQTRDFIYVDDLLDAIRLAASLNGVGGETFQIATCAETTLNELLDTLLTVLKKKGLLNVEVTYSPPRLGDVKRNFSDTSKAKRMLNWQAKTSLAQGISLTVDWFLTHLPLQKTA